MLKLSIRPVTINKKFAIERHAMTKIHKSVNGSAKWEEIKKQCFFMPCISFLTTILLHNDNSISTLSRASEFHCECHRVANMCYGLAKRQPMILSETTY